jgi:hypothetical protein
MGLDMYLTAKRYLWSGSEQDQKIAKKLAELVDVEPDFELRFKGASFCPKQVVIDAMYWRKANMIHQWFVENVQEGEDNCEEYYVPREDLETLLAECVNALTTRNGDILPPKSGFFFGSTEINEWYWQDLEDTVQGLEKALTLSEDWDFAYRASW